MPSRVIRGEINASRSLSRVSLEADLTFRALLVAVDDFGRCEADPLMLKAVLYPRRPAVSPEMVAQWVGELAAEGCVQSYVVDGVRYLQLTGHERHRSNGRRAAKSRFPEPPHGVPGGSEEAPSRPRISEEVTDDPRACEEIRPSVVCRVASSGEAGSDGEAVAEADASAPEIIPLETLFAPDSAEKTTARARKEQRACRMPSDFTLTDQMAAQVRSAGCLNPRVAFEHFRNFHTAKGSKFVDWGAAWRTWCGNHAAYACPCKRTGVAARGFDAIRQVAAEGVNS